MTSSGLTEDMVPEGAVMVVWVIYDHPKDFPDVFVARPQFAMQDGSVVPCPLAFMHEDIDVIRNALAGIGLTCMARDPNDDAKIVETWL